MTKDIERQLIWCPHKNRIRNELIFESYAPNEVKKNCIYQVSVGNPSLKTIGLENVWLCEHSPQTDKAAETHLSWRQ